MMLTLKKYLLRFASPSLLLATTSVLHAQTTTPGVPNTAFGDVSINTTSIILSIGLLLTGIILMKYSKKALSD